MAIKEKVTKLYYRKSMRVIAGVEPGKILLQIIAADAYTTDEEGNMRNMKITTIISAGMPARCR